MKERVNERLNERYWIWITEVGNIPPREGRAVTVAGRELAIFNLGDRFVAVDNKCPHKGGPLSQGIVHGDTVTCPLHGMKIGLKDGEAVAPDKGCTRRFEVKAEDGTVWLQLN